METTLQMVLSMQANFQRKFGYDENETDIEKISSLVHSHSAFIIEEVNEMLREMPYHKYWKDYDSWSEEKIEEQLEAAREEWIDVFIFLSNVALFLGLDEEKIREMYLEKNKINIKFIIKVLNKS